MKRKIFLILRPSKINGVGVFALTDIKKGARIPLFIYIDCKRVNRVRGPIELTKYACDDDKYGVWIPLNWHRMSIGWYLNESLNPNVRCRSWTALRSIKSGEELTINYADL